jgi:anthranilate synthase component II
MVDDSPTRIVGGVAATRVLVIDSYDSFVFNLVQYLGELGAEPIVHRNDAITVADAVALDPDGVVLSPGPGRPEHAGILCAAVTEFADRGVPVLGVCLGNQAIGQVYGATVVGAATLMHGKTSEISHDGRGVFDGLPSPLTATRYHSLTLAPESIPDALVVTATADDGTVMGVRHRRHAVEGVQFHPESILTGCGHQLLANFLRICGGGSVAVESGGPQRVEDAAGLVSR